MRPPFRYFGGKARIAPWIVSLMPPHDAYIEAFLGAGAVFFTKPQVRHEIINDIDGMITNFYRVLRDRSGELADHCRLTPYARDEFSWCKANYSNRGLDDLERARIFFAVVAQSFACTTGSASGWSASMKKSVHRARSTQYYVNRFAAISDRIQVALIENHTATYVIETHGDTPKCLIYADPPYVHSTRGDTSRPGGGHGYAQEMTDPQHEDLARVLHATPATVLLSGYHSELYDDLYADWYQTSIETYSTVAGIAVRAKDTSRTEVVWSNRPIHDGKLPFAQVLA